MPLPRLAYAVPFLTILASCSTTDSLTTQDLGTAPPMRDPDPGKADQPNELNLAAGSMVLYEIQVRSANACRTDLGSPTQQEACRNKIAPSIPYRAENMSCPDLDQLNAIRLGTLDDMLEDTSDFRQGITLRYVQEKVGANTIWLMPLFPNNDQWSIPHECDNLGSPYAVRDYLHARGTLSRTCILARRDEYSEQPCWGNDALRELIDDAHARGLKVMLDVAFNHFGHNYNMYDVASFTPIRRRVERGENLDGLWNFQATEESAHIHPTVLDQVEQLEALGQSDAVVRDDLASLKAKCSNLSGQSLLTAFHMWRDALDWERASFSCTARSLEEGLPGFYLGSNAKDPSTRLGDNFTNDWRDVKFLYHQERNGAHRHEFVRQREYIFRILNYWVAQGVDGFRLDHTTDPFGGMAPNEWKYLLSKVDYYAWRRGQARPVYLAEEFSDQMGMNNVVDVMTEGYVGDMAGRGGRTKNTSHIEAVVNNMRRFNGHAFVMTALETHDEHRLMHDTGFTPWTGAGFWGIGATTRSTPMMLMGQEFGEPYGLGFRRSDLLRGRFEGSENYRSDANDLVAAYHTMIAGRLDPSNEALLQPTYAMLRTREGSIDERIFAQVKWSSSGNVVFVVHNLWEQNVSQVYGLNEELRKKLSIQPAQSYRLFDLLTGEQKGACRSGDELADEFYVEMGAKTRAQWLRLELCE